MDAFSLARPILHSLDPETAHNLTLRALEWGLVPSSPSPRDPVLATTLFGKQLDNPVGLSAGFDKNARVPHRMEALGFGFIEVGGVTPKPQIGNPRPRLFRLAQDRAIINRMGFNNQGLAVVSERLAAKRGPGLVGVNMASNSDSDDPAGDFLTLIRGFAPIADFLTIDISCPNTRNGKLFMEKGPLDDLLGRVGALFTDGSLKRPALVAKIAPDVDDGPLADIVASLIAAGIDGMVISNTTVARPDSLASPQAGERGGLSGKPLFRRATEVLAQVATLAEGRLTLVGVGGIDSGETAYAKIRAGASAVQLYSALVYEGPALIARINRELAALLKADGFGSVAAAVGADLPAKAPLAKAS